RLDFIPRDTVVLTDRPELLEPLTARPADALVLSVGDVPATPEAVAEAIEKWGRPVRHLRVVADLGASAPARDCLWQESPSLVALHDLAFLTLQAGFESLSEEGASVIALLLDALPDGSVHPLGGLFSGLLK